MILLAIDPGTTQSGYVYYDIETRHIHRFGKVENHKLIELVQRLRPDHLAIEMIACYGMSVGKEVFETCLWAGRFIQQLSYIKHTLVYRREVKMFLCNSVRAKDSNVRQALIDLFGGNTKAIGGKKCPKCHGKGWVGRDHAECPVCGGKGWESEPGPLKGFSGDMWAALGVAVTWADKFRSEGDEI